MSDMTGDSVGQVESGCWLTIVDAARHFRVHTRTIERRIKAGELQRRPGSFPVEVWVPGASGEDMTPLLSDTSGDTVGQEDRAVALIERVSDSVARQLTTAIEALERSQARNAELERENGVLSERIEAAQQLSDEVRKRLEAERDAARVELAAAKAYADALQAQQEARETAETPESVLESPTVAEAPPVIPSPGNGAPWWRRWLGTVYG